MGVDQFLTKYGKRAGGAVAILGLLAILYPLLRSDLPPYASIERVEGNGAHYAQNFQDLQTQQRAMALAQAQQARLSVSIALTVYKAQRDQAQAQVDAATRAGKRDLAAEALRDNAEQAIMSITNQVLQPAR